ncbi:MAG: response regulator [Gammaproteobacteria bacterium]
MNTTTMQHILVVDDDQEILDMLGTLLKQYGFKVSLASDGEQMYQLLEQSKPDLFVLDVMLPGDDGFELCRQLRQRCDTPIIMLTAIGESTDRIVGLEMGADDYIAKPFNPRELIARIKAVLRRAKQCAHLHDNSQTEQAGDIIEFAGWKLDIGRRRLLSPDNCEIALSSGEYDLLLVFVQHPQRVLSRDQLLDQTRNRPAGPFDRTIDVQISRLRQKIETDPKNPELIKTIRGGGYMLTSPVKRK